MTDLEEHLFGIPLSTHRDRSIQHGPFPYELWIAAISIAFCRITIYTKNDHSKWIFAGVLGYMAYESMPYEYIVGVELFSYVVPLVMNYTGGGNNNNKSQKNPPTTEQKLAILGACGALCWSICHSAGNGALFRWLSLVTPSFVKSSLMALFPVEEIRAAYHIIDQFVWEPGLLQHQVSRLFFITFHIQCGIGYLGIDFLKAEQERRNQLVRMDLKDDGIKKKKDSKQSEALLKKSRSFQKSAAPFIFFVAVPYMIKIIAFGNLNAFAFACFNNDVHRAVRLHDLFDHENNLVALASHSAKSPADYADYMSVVVSTTYDLFNRKLFSLPKVMLLPMIIMKQPKMLAQLFPIIFVTDWMKGRAVAYMTTRIEQLEKDTQKIISMRSKVESFDIKNAELLQRAGGGATDFTRRRWEELTEQIQVKNIAKDLTARTKGFFAWIERNFVFSVLIDCALAHLIAVGRLVSADIFVFSRAIEDAVDTVLMKSRSEAELARMMTQIDNLKEIASVWENAQSRNLVDCNLPPARSLAAIERGDPERSMVVIRNLLYSRGTAMVRVDHLELDAGIYALTGGNGSGKSTLFRVIMGCSSNERGIDLPPSIVLSTPLEPLVEEDDIEREQLCESAEVAVESEQEPSEVAEKPSADIQEVHPRLSITMPSSDVVEISQTFYWPLYTKPIDWIYQEYGMGTVDEAELQNRVRRVAEELDALEFAQAPIESDQNTTSLEASTMAPSADIVGGIMDQLVEEKEDWFGDLSGGQRSKVELVRKVFLQEQCPGVLLIDETMAPLDPKSKSLVMAKIKAFCAGSVVIVIYHTDVGRETDGEGGEAVECVPSNDFFDGNLHVENKILHLRPVC
ncbi:unnamed protein product [Cylindrotheca closterium]|uniref:ABC transporter domain-containing protein n=1 Tax=Cylindrotheca closterium TaxID=2856 RepID=A0AAD2G5H5_9STRA|nr:unnamed protein product [Cylindrotheca closterium]